MRESDLNKPFLFALPWDWTVVGSFVGMVGERLELREAGYFTRTGTTFDKLCKDGFVAETVFHALQAEGGRLLIPNVGLVFPWAAAWPQRRQK